ncbi:MAG: small multi-drug export protein [Thermotogae bacterium]|nr:small multi-drug export protein [Thermotogota bacterium]
MPILELRGAIPLGVFYYGMPVWKALLIAIAGNLLPVPFLLILLRPLNVLSRRWWLTRRFFNWLYDRARRKGISVQRLKALGVFLFVAIPMPGTGAWMGSVVAEVFDVPFATALLSITLGVITAGILIALASYVGWWAVALLFGILLILSYLLSRR